VLVSVADVWLDAKLNVPRMTPTEQRAIAPKARRLKTPDCEAELFCIGLSFQQIGEEASSNFSCFEFLLANGGVLRDRKQAVEHFPTKTEILFAPLPASSCASAGVVPNFPHHY